jgi:hypothetical protein
LIKTGDNTAISGTPKVLSDGNGNNLPMEVSTTGVNLTGLPTVNSVAIANTTQVAAKQDTLVSGTNIKTINSTSILGSGNISVVTSPSGVSGAIQFSNGSAFASDATKLFWDDTNKRLGIGTNVPSARFQVQGDGTNDIARFSEGGGLLAAYINNRGEVGTKSEFADDGGFVGWNGNFGVKVFAFKRNNVGGLSIQSYQNIGFSVNGSYSTSSYDMELTTTGLLAFGGTTSSFPSIKRNGTAIDFRLADDSGFCPVNTGVLSIQNTVATAVSVASTHKVTVVIGGTTYYLLASNV